MQIEQRETPSPRKHKRAAACARRCAEPDRQIAPRLAAATARRLHLLASEPDWLTALGSVRLDGGHGVLGLDLRGHRQEGLLDVLCVLGRRFEECDGEGVGELLGGLKLDDLLADHVALVADQQLLHALGRVAIDFIQPLLDIVKRVLIGDVVHDDDAVCAAVVRAGDGAETLLTGSVPNLELDHLAVELDRSDLEVDANGRDVRVRVRIVGETQEQARLADARVANQQELHTENARVKNK